MNFHALISDKKKFPIGTKSGNSETYTDSKLLRIHKYACQWINMHKLS